MIGRCLFKYAAVFSISCLVWIMCAAGCATLSPEGDASRTDAVIDPKPIESGAHQRESVVRSEHEDGRPEAKETKDVAATVPSLEQGMAPTDLAVEEELLHPASKMSEIDFLIESERISFYIFTDARLYNFNAIYLTGPPRLAVDLMGLQSSDVIEPLSLDGPWVKKVRVGLYSDKVRVVFDLIPGNEPPYQILPIQRGLEVVFNPASD